MSTNNFTIENLAAVLTAEDKAYCDKLFLQYEDLQNLTRETFIDCNRKIFEYNEAGSHPFAKEVKILAAHMENVASSMNENTRSLVSIMEGYFETKYSLEGFPSLLKSASYKVGDLLTNYEPVIANMINKTRMNFIEGKPLP